MSALYRAAYNGISGIGEYLLGAAPGTVEINRDAFADASSEDAFAAATTAARSLPSLKVAQRLRLYGLYKQATEGDCEGERPGLFAGVAARSKYDAWKAQAGKLDYDARDDYIEEARLQMSEHS